MGLRRSLDNLAGRCASRALSGPRTDGGVAGGALILACFGVAFRTMIS